MAYAHPLLQVAAWLLGLYALALAWPRVASLHLGQSRRFNRRRHQITGLAALGLMLLGTLGGALLGRLYLGAWLSSGAHAWGGLLVLALGLWGLGSGLWLANRPQPRRLLPLLHGLGNLLLLILALLQARSGRALLLTLAGGGQ
ncbi:MAG: DUF4079 domain-containing protein [Desulfarculus sp.]|nr:DUF4079 domain-containing protein [Desulfarculus sp.]